MWSSSALFILLFLDACLGSLYSIHAPMLVPHLLSPLSPTEIPDKLDEKRRMSTESTEQLEQQVIRTRKVREVTLDASGALRRLADDSILPTKRNYKSDIYWRPWNLHIPEDAVVGGYKNGECGRYPIYLAQAYLRFQFDSAVIPVEIFAKSRGVHLTYQGRQLNTRKDIKVLCVSDPTVLTWVPKEEAGRYKITYNKDCVVAGTEEITEQHTYFGRLEYEGDTVIGKVMHQKNTTYFPYYGDEVPSEKYEILCYKESIESRKRKFTEEKINQTEAEEQNRESEKS